MKIVAPYWQSPPPTYDIASQEVHIWLASPSALAAHRPQFYRWLSTEEQARAQRYHFEKDCHKYIVARGLLRKLLGHYLQLAPDQVSFRYNAYGKPELHLPGNSLRFNLSHSHDLVLYAFTRTCEVGIDVEYMRPDIDFIQLANHAFSPAEQKELLALPLTQRARGFYRGWTLKEAYIKGRGQGISLGLDQFDVALTPGQPAALLANREALADPQSWFLHIISTTPDYAAALAVEGKDVTLKYYHYTYVL